MNKFFSFFAKRTLVLFNEVGKHLYGEVKLLTLSMKKEEKNILPSKKYQQNYFVVYIPLKIVYERNHKQTLLF